MRQILFKRRQKSLHFKNEAVWEKNSFYLDLNREGKGGRYMSLPMPNLPLNFRSTFFSVKTDDKTKSNRDCNPSFSQNWWWNKTQVSSIGTQRLSQFYRLDFFLAERDGQTVSLVFQTMLRKCLFLTSSSFLSCFINIF